MRIFHWNGSAWARQQPPPGDDLNALSVSCQASGCTAVGDQDGVEIASTGSFAAHN